jgi:Spy/CpxP family protein refolding chaperone
MTEAIQDTKSVRKPRSLEEEITVQRDKLKKLEERQRENQRKDRERNTKSVLELIRAEKLDLVSAENWKSALPTIKEALQLK